MSCIAIRRVFGRFSQNQDGAALLIFTIFLGILIAAVGAGIDYARALVVQQRLINAADATAVAVARNPSLSEAEVQTMANAYINAHYADSDFGEVTARSVLTEDDKVSVELRAQMGTSIMQLVGVGSVDVVAKTEVLRRQRKLEVVMVLDNTGSMCNPNCAVKLDQLKASANKLVDILFDGETISEHVKIGLVPFAATVNIGADKVTSGWLDTAGISPLQSEDIDLPAGTSLLGLYDQLSNVSWNGCVRARSGLFGLDVTDTPPDVSFVESLWTPYFAPDEPGAGNGPGDEGLGYYYNDYLSDVTIPGSAQQKQRNASKYIGATVPTAQLAAGRGPNFNCVPQSVQALTNTKSTITSAIAGMQAAGSTVIPSGLSWGWRVISPAAPYNQGAAYSDQDTIKAVILLTDGANQVESNIGHNNSFYSSYGYAASGHLGPTGGSQANETLDDKTATICNNIRGNHDDVADDNDIFLYTISFVNEQHVGAGQAAAIRTMLQNCATPDAQCPGQKCFYDSPSPADLETAFSNIAIGLSELRIAK